MQYLIMAAAILSISGCVAMGKDMHTERALDECDALIDVSEQQACRQTIHEARHQRDMEDRNSKDD
ncbi:MAG: hypothetical protein CME88_07440 [Hirschia sp.]|nr:hypothetical protein [Hirschia sp.]MBF18194.1 hypothetical protein [Hirschia sp.]|tara:strand:- start:356 stop:553 length:198 start_codon:yes stop_codon:yes gene_type:complete